MVSTKATAAERAYNTNTRNADSPCTACGCLAVEEHHDHIECSGCGWVTRKPPESQTTLDHDNADETASATDAEVQMTLDQVLDEFDL